MRLLIILSLNLLFFTLVIAQQSAPIEEVCFKQEYFQKIMGAATFSNAKIRQQPDKDCDTVTVTRLSYQKLIDPAEDELTIRCFGRDSFHIVHRYSNLLTNGNGEAEELTNIEILSGTVVYAIAYGAIVMTSIRFVTWWAFFPAEIIGNATRVWASKWEICSKTYAFEGECIPIPRLWKCKKNK